MSWHGTAAAIAHTQHGVVGRSQLIAAGATPPAIRNLLRSDVWERVTTRVLRSTTVSYRPESMAMAAVLDVSGDAWLSHRSAAAVWGLPGFDLRSPEVVALHRDRHVVGELGRVHRGRDLPTQWLTHLDGLPVVRPELMVLQLCGTEPRGRAERALDTAWSMGLLTGRSLVRLIEDMSDRGRTGMTLIRALLDERGRDYSPPASGLEARFAALLSRHGLPPMDRQVNLGADDWVGRVDFYHRPHRLVVEVDSERYHSALVDARADAERTAKLEAAGFTEVRVTDVQVWQRPMEVVARVRSGHVLARSRQS